MSKIIARIKTEPAVFISFIGALVSLGATYTAGTMDLQAGVMALVTIVVGFVVRSQVVPVSKVVGSNALES